MTEFSYVCRDWRVDLSELLGEIADAAQRDAVPPNLKRRFRVIWRAAVHCSERRQATRYVERGVAYARKLLIAAGLPRAARDLYPEQLKYRRIAHRINGLWANWLLEWLWWFAAGAGLSGWGLARLFLFIVVVVLGGFALLYRYPEPRIMRNDDPTAPLFWYHYVYFSGATLTTLGFGDVVPKHENAVGMFLAVAEGIIGYILLGTSIYALSTFRRGVPPPEDDWEEMLLRRIKD